MIIAYNIRSIVKSGEDDAKIILSLFVSHGITPLPQPILNAVSPSNPTKREYRHFLVSSALYDLCRPFNIGVDHYIRFYGWMPVFFVGYT